MKINKKTQLDSLPEFFLERLWYSYFIIDNRRRKSFNLLLLSLIFLFLIWIAHTDKVRVPFLGTELNIFLTLSLAPIVISFLTTRYLYLSAHTINLYISYLIYYQSCYKEELDKFGYDLKKLYKDFRIRDISDSVNIFIFPRKFNKKWRFSFDSILHYLAMITGNIIILSTVIIPIVTSLTITIWFGKNYSLYIANPQGMIIFIIYILSHIFIFLALVYLFQRIKDAISIYRDKIDI